MSSQSAHPISSPPPGVSPPSSGGVRRHHTISAASRTSRTSSKVISEEEQQAWNEDEVVDLDWVGGVGAVGEKSSLHRQTSLPTRYHRGFAGQAARQQGTLTPRTLNSLSAIAGHEGEEEDWEREIADLRGDDEQSLGSSEQHLMDPSSPPFGATQVPSPPPASSGVRRHQSLTYPNAGGPRMGGLKRAGTLQAPPIKGHQSQGHSSAQSPSPTNADEDEDEGAEEESYFPQNQYPTSPIGRSSPWGTPGGNEWRTPGGSGNPVDDVSRALNALELSQSYQSSNYQQQGQSIHPPRFNPAHPPPQQAPGMRRGSQSGSNTPGTSNQVAGPSGRGLQLVTDLDGRTATPITQGVVGPVSASAYVPPIGHGPGLPTLNQHPGNTPTERQHMGRDRALTTSGTATWDQKERVLGGRTSNPSLHHLYQAPQGGKSGNGIPTVPPIPAQFLNQGHAPRMGSSADFAVSNVGVSGLAQGRGGNGGGSIQMPLGMDGISSPVDVPTLLATKGYNPVDFDIKPIFARFFVIKSYTEDDVHKSLKYEIWSSTDPGNKRLDKAFKETAGRGPIYLFFSVNASGHFCGMAEMLTPVDYTRSSTVWASDKWKGVFKVRWIYVRDIPNTNLRHIRLNNTQERKPVTNSRDTQELLPDAGQEMLRIFHTHPARTSLLQDFAFYELQSLQKVHVQQQGTASPPPVHMSSPSIQQGTQSPNMNSHIQGTPQHPFAMSNPNALAFAAQQMGMSGMGMNIGMNPMLQMQMNMNVPFNNPAAMQSVMRNPSPGPVPLGSQGFMGPQF